MTLRLLIEEGIVQTRAALVDEAGVRRLWVSATAAPAVLMLGRVERTEVRLGGAFLNIGEKRDGFLPVAEGPLPAQGSLLLVQIKRPALGDKGALLTTEINLQTPILSWQPLAGKRKLIVPPGMTSKDEQARLSAALDEVGFKGTITLRPLAAGLAPEQLRRSFSALRQSWDAMRAQSETQKSPGTLAVADGTQARALLTEFADWPVKEIVIAGPQLHAAMGQSLARHLSHRAIDLSSAEPGFFEREGIVEAVETALDRTVSLPGGGRLVFDETEALTAVDVDIAATPGQSKRGAIIRACVDAVPVIFRELSLRQIGGQVVIDFPALALKAAPGKSGGPVMAALKTAVKHVPGARLGRLESRGLVALTLPRLTMSLLDQVTEPYVIAPISGRRFTMDWLADEALGRAEQHLAVAPQARVELGLADELKNHIEAHSVWLNKLNERYGVRLTLVSEPQRAREEIDVREV